MGGGGAGECKAARCGEPHQDTPAAVALETRCLCATPVTPVPEGQEAGLLNSSFSRLAGYSEDGGLDGGSLSQKSIRVFLQCKSENSLYSVIDHRRASLRCVVVRAQCAGSWGCAPAWLRAGDLGLNDHSRDRRIWSALDVPRPRWWPTVGWNKLRPHMLVCGRFLLQPTWPDPPTTSRAILVRFHYATKMPKPNWNRYRETRAETGCRAVTQLYS